MNNDSHIETEHDRVYYTEGSENLKGRGEFDVAKRIADAFPSYKVLVTIGPWRSHDMMWEIEEDSNLIKLDFYSVRPTGTYRVENVIGEIRDKLRWKDDD